MTTYMFVKIEKNPFDDIHKKPTDPHAFYSWELKVPGSDWVTGSGFNYSKVLLLMKHFKVISPSQLIGRTFESEKNDPCTALDWFLIEIAHGGSYTAPSAPTIRNRALVSLANMECPDYSDLPGEAVASAFAEVWSGFEADEEWLSAFTDKLFILGGVVLRKGDIETFSLRVKGPASYLELVHGALVQRVIIGPYSSPVIFD